MRKLFCLFGRHDYALVQKLTPHSRKIGCRVCRRMFGMNDDARAVIPWDGELEEMYRTIGVLPKEPT
jgi:hypothetical protein